MKKLLFILIVLTAFLFNGCLVYEEYDSEVILPKDGKPGIVKMTYYNIASTDTTEEKIEKDFNELIEFYAGDEFLLDQVDEGVYLKNRYLNVNDGKIIGKYAGIFSNLSKLEGISEDEKQITFKIDNEFELIESNGKISKIGEQSYIVWKRGTEKLYWKLKNRGFSTEGRTNLAKKLEKYITENPNKF